METPWAQCCAIVPSEVMEEHEIVLESSVRTPQTLGETGVNIWKGARLRSTRGKSAENRIRAS